MVKDISIESYLETCWLMTKRWVEDIETKKIVANKWIKLAIERYRRDLKREDLEFRNEEVDRVLKFFYFARININNEYKRFIPVPFQVFFIMNIFGFYYKGTNKRKYRYAYLFIARKNGKTVLSALLQLYGLLGDRVEDPVSLLVANTREQAQIALQYATGIINHSPALNKRLDPQRYLIKLKGNNQIGYSKTLASNSNRLDGYNPSIALVDECHAMTDHSIFNVIKSGTLARENPLIILTTTAGFSMDSLAFDLFEAGKRALSGDIVDDSFFYMLFCLDEGDNYEDTNLWVKSNPSINQTLYLEDLISEWNQSKHLPTQKDNFLTKNLNLFLDQSEAWIPQDDVRKRFNDLNLDDFAGEKCWAGIDLSSTKDLTALSLLFQRDGKFYVFPFYFFANNPEKRIRKGGVDLTYWIREGYIFQCMTPTIDYNILFDTIKTLSGKFQIEKLCYDQFNSALIVPRLQEIGIYCEPFAQNAMKFNFPIKYMEKMIYDGEIIFQKNPALLWNFRNIVLYKDGNNNVKFMKNKSLDSIDGAVSTAMSIGAFLSMRQYDFSLSEEKYSG